MKWLVNVSHVVDDQTESKGLLIFEVAEVAGNLVDVVAVTCGDCTLKESSKVIQALDNVIGRLCEVVVINVTTLIKVWKVDIMPTCLPRVSHSLDIVSKGSTLSEWVVTLVLSNAWVVLLERS